MQSKFKPRAGDDGEKELMYATDGSNFSIDPTMKLD